MEKNYIQNNGKAKGKIYIGLDHGYGNIKTAHRVFTTGVEAYDEEPIVSTNFVKYREKYYVIGESHLVYQGNKTDSDDIYILTLAGLAEELKFRGLHEAEVVLAVGKVTGCRLESISDAGERTGFHVPKGTLQGAFMWCGNLSAGTGGCS